MQYVSHRHSDEMHQLRVRIGRLEEALKPFAEIARELNDELRDDYKNTMHWAVPKVGDFRLALNTLNDTAADQ